MPSILKRFTAPAAKPYEFPEAESLIAEAAPAEQELFHADPFDSPAFQPDGRSPGEAPSTPAKSSIDFAQVQAEAIIEDARRQADELLERARQDAEEELEQLRVQAQQSGYQMGYAEGMSRAMAEAQQQRTAQAVELGAEVQQFLERATIARDEMLEQTQGELRDLALAVAEKIVRVSLKSSGEIVARMIQGATEKLKKTEWVHIYIAGCDAKGIAKVTPQLTASLSFLSNHVKIFPMADDESGTCIIEMPDEIIDASASTQLSNIRDLLSGN